MRTSILLLAIAALLLAACGGATTQPAAILTESPVQPAATEAMPDTGDPATATAPPTEVTVPTTQAPPTEAPATVAPSTQAASSAGAVVYTIVPGESQLTYEVGEVFINDNNRFNLASGVTPQVSGEITVDLSAPQNSQIGTITADISQFKSDSNRRDNAIRTRFLQSNQYPNVTFVPTSIEGLPGTYSEGQEIPLKISGDLTIREVTKPVEFDATVKLAGGTLTSTATTTILMSDFGFGPIDILGMLKTEDEAKVTLNLVARP
jgi:polyisoprenoid-binding protein YceI